MAAIDVHTHAFPDDIAERAIAKLSAEGDWSAVGKGTVSALLESMDAADIDLSILCAIATKPDQVRGIFRWCRKIRSERIIPLPSVHPGVRKPDAWVVKIAKAGFVGIKLHPMYQDFVVDEPALDPIYAAAAERQLLVALHCGKDIAFPPDDDRAAPRRVRAVLDRHPSLRLIATHMGGWNMWEEVREHLLGTQALLETSFSLAHMPPEEATDMIRRHGADKVLFGTDWPWNDQAAEIQRVKQLDLTAPQRRAILCNNAARLLGF